MKIRYKISSCSSQSPTNPVSNLISNNGCWQSARFCPYPQQITLMFYEPIKINKIKIIVHQTKVPEKISILYHLPTVDNQNQYTKLGYVSFKPPIEENPSQSPQNKKSILKELKVINNLDLQAQYLRLIISKNYVNKSNFFHQVGISSIQVQGTGFQMSISSVQLKNDSMLKISNYTRDKLVLLNQFKDKCIQKQQYTQANQIKEIIEQIKLLVEEIKYLNQQKIKCISQENYIEAKQIKLKIDKIKSEIQHMSNNFYDPAKKKINKFQLKLQKSRLKQLKQTHLQKNKSMTTIIGENQFLTQNDKDQTNKQQLTNRFEQGTIINDELYQSRLQHQQRIVPAVFNKLKNSNADIKSQKPQAENEFLQDSRVDQQTLPEYPQELSPSNQANASVLAEFYQKLTIQKLHSKYWQFKNQALQQILQQSKQHANSSLTKNKLRSYIFVYNRIMQKQNNKQLMLIAIDLINQVTGMKIQESDFKTQMTRQLEKSIIQTLDKIQHQAPNPKIKMQAQKVIIRMIQSHVFGSGLVYHAIIKAYNDKLNSKIKKIYLQNLQYIVSHLQPSNVKSTIPHTIVDFTVKRLNDPNNEVRKSAINLLKTLKKVGYEERIKICISQESSSLKQSYLKQLNL